MSAHSHAGAIQKYIVIYLLLMVLLVVTVAVAFFDLGAFNLPVAMLIASVKAGLVVWFFMHVDHASVMIRFCVGASLVGLFLAFLFTFADYLTRGASMLQMAN
jgi:cytochrome c oxidase subunit 4